MYIYMFVCVCVYLSLSLSRSPVAIAATDWARRRTRGLGFKDMVTMSMTRQLNFHEDAGARTRVAGEGVQAPRSWGGLLREGISL